MLHTQTYYITYQWYKELVAIPGATTYSTVSTGPGNYKVAVTDTNGCQSVSDAYPLLTTNGVATITNPDEVKIYPNPVQNTVHIDAPVSVRAVITGIDGKTIIDQSAAKEIDVSNLANGMYLIVIYDDSGQVVKIQKLAKTGY